MQKSQILEEKGSRTWEQMVIRHGPVGNGTRGECVLEIESKFGVLFEGDAFFVLGGTLGGSLGLWQWQHPY